MTTEYENTESGQISIDNEVIKNIALRAATEVEGITEIRGGYMSKIWGMFSKNPARGVSLQMGRNSELNIRLRVLIGYGTNIPHAAGAVQEKVKKAVEHMTGLTVNEVTVKIIGMRPKVEEPFKEDKAFADDSLSVQDDFVSG